MARLKDKYRKELVPRLMEVAGYKNVMQVPRLEKIVINIGVGEAISNAKLLENAEQDLVAITGQHPVITRAKKGSLHDRRIASGLLTDESVVKKLFDELGPRFESRAGGYTRVVKLGRRKGDAAPMAILELVL